MPMTTRSLPRWTRRALLLLISSTALTASASALEARWILQQLAQPAPSQTGFVELRGSALLKEPLRVEGQYRRPDNATLVREVSAPYAETTTIAEGKVSIARAGKPPRVFALQRVPELADLQTSFGALLSGDQAALEQAYRLEPQGTPQRWQLRLAPRGEALARRVASITLHGRGNELRCIETRPAKGDVQRTLLGGAAVAAAAVRDADALTALCHDGGSR
ncbi:fatty acyl CoA synthetase [Stenotrophomonas pictorum JCM 9942]|uniref:Fatty acyl CoA synthetase n=3 Tax=Stenotrophomonas pictorum TaxID=86184 RepID=A0A0R0AJM5_9GAMM|nr:LolA-related protein [Stenotrophomonas pictorum]KRG45221.1 fatty acyl CoA synthetase [Stenotrophomonas pictorum JCM 9942]